MRRRSSLEFDYIKLTLGEIFSGYKNTEGGGVSGLDGKLNIRPKYQRDYVYSDEMAEAVVQSVYKDWPLGSWFFATNPDGSYEVLDGQQRILSLMRYMDGVFSVDFNNGQGHKYFHSLDEEDRNFFKGYSRVTVNVSIGGTTAQKIDFFKIINIAGLPLSTQELRNSEFTGAWLEDVKFRLSRQGSIGDRRGKLYIKGSRIRQDYLETMLDWESNGNIEDYMSKHQPDKNGDKLVESFEKHIDWFESVFTEYRTPMFGMDIGKMYRLYGSKKQVYDPVEMENQVSKLMADGDVENRKGIYWYVFDGKQSHLNLRKFNDTIRGIKWEQQKGICVHCEEYFKLKDMQADHKIPWSKGGKTDMENCQMLCKHCNAVKSNN